VYLAIHTLGLQDVIKIDQVFYRRDAKRGWQFLPSDPQLFLDFEKEEELMSKLQREFQKKDSKYGYRYVREIYEKFDSTEKSVPLLINNVTGEIVSNESAEIVKMLSDHRDDLLGNPKTTNDKYLSTLYPSHLVGEIEILNDYIYSNINNGSYKAGFSSKQETYDTAFAKYFVALDRLNDILREKRFLTGNTFTAADLRLYPTIVRHDPVYYARMKLNAKMIADYPHLNRWFRDVKENIAGVAEAVKIEYSVLGYFGRTGTNIIPYLGVRDNEYWY